MNKAWLIARNEFITNLRKPSYLFTAFGTPIFIIIILVIVMSIVFDAEENTDRLGTIGFVDLSGVLASPVEVPENYQAFDSEESARAALQAKDIGAYFVVSQNYLTTGAVSVVSTTSIPSALKDEFDAFLIANLGRDLEAGQLDRLIEPINSEILTLDTGRKIAQGAFMVILFMPFIFVFVFMMGSQTTSTYLMSSVVEEKTNRLMEILITSVTPLQLMAGKILGLGALGLMQLTVWLSASVIILSAGQALPFLQGVTVPVDMIVLGLIYFILAYFLYSAIMAGIGAVVGSETESRQYASIFSLISTIPFFLIISFFTDPNGPVVTFLTLFPFTSPVSVIMRVAWGSMPIEQIILSIALLLVTTIAAVWMSARVFRWALLLYGKRPSIGQIIGALRRRSPAMATTAATTVETTGGR